VIEVLFTIGGIPILSSGFTWMLGVVVVYLTGWPLAKLRGITHRHWVEYLLILVVTGLVGARLGHVFSMSEYYSQNPVEVFYLHEGGMTYYYGLLLGFSCGAFYGWYRSRCLEFIDLGLVNACLAHVFGRFGCFLYGCCYGMICPPESPFHAFSHQVIGLDGFRYPIQLMSALALLVLYLVLRQIYLHNRTSGTVALVYLSSYAVLRFCLEFFRDDPRGTLGIGWLDSFSTSQGIAILCLVVLIPMNFYALIRKS